MRIGLSSIIGDGFGNGSFSFGEVPSGGGHEAGDYAYTAYGVTYPIAEGGASVEVTELSGNTYPSQICDVDYVYEAGGGTTPDWSTVSNIQYRPNGFYHAGDGTLASQTPVEVPFESGIYFDSEYITEYAALADGYGGYTWTPYGVGYWDADTFIYNPEGSGDYYYWDGDGSYYYVG
jgi:hypothetical protein